MITIAFFWVGENTDIPVSLVKSVRLVMGHAVNLVQLTNRETKEIEGVTSVHRFQLSPKIMVARLEAYSYYKPETDEVFFCDADCLFINKLSLPYKNANGIYLSKRQEDFKLNHNYPEYYEEFVNKTVNQVMPFLFGALATKGNQQKFFQDLLNTCLELPEKFHRWYGDQYSLYLNTKDKKDSYLMLDPNVYQYVIKKPLLINELKKLHKNNVQMLHFKGPDTKILLEQAFILISFFYEELKSKKN